MELERYTEKLRHIVSRMDNLPSLPMVVTKILQLIGQSDSAAKDLADVISKDHSLTAKVIRLVNSPFFGISRNITSIQQSVVLLGFHTIKNLAIGLSTYKSIGEPNGDSLLQTERFWEHSLATAVCAKEIAKEVRYNLPDEAFVAGLLHDVGKLILNQVLTEEYNQVIKIAESENMSTVDAEEEIIGVPHTIMGEWLAEEWKFPLLLKQAIRCHEAPLSFTALMDHSTLKLTCMVNIADQLSNNSGYNLSTTKKASPINVEIMEVIQLKEGKVGALAEGIKEEVDKVKQFFGV